MSGDVVEPELPVCAAPTEWQQVTLGKVVRIATDSISAPDLAALAEVHHYSLPAYDEGAGPEIGPGDTIKSNKTIVPDDCVLFSKLNPRIPRIWRIRGDAPPHSYCSTEFWPLVAKFRGVDLDYLTHYLSSPAFLGHPSITPSSSTNSHQRVDRRAFEGFEFPLPPLDEQRRIAEVMRSVDEAIAAADCVIDQLRETRSHQLEALMTLPGAYRRIEEVCRLSGGFGFPIKHQGKEAGRYPFAKVSDMNRPGNEVQMRHAENYIDDADIRTLKAKTFPVGTTFFPKVGATLLTNKRRIAAVEMLVDNNVMGAIATDVDPWFLYYTFCTIDMADYVQPGAVPSVNQRTIGQIMIPVPDRAAQEGFVETMRDVDAAIETQSDALAQLKAAKQALSSDLLSGRVRVPA